TPAESARSTARSTTISTRWARSRCGWVPATVISRPARRFTRPDLDTTRARGMPAGPRTRCPAGPPRLAPALERAGVRRRLARRLAGEDDELLDLPELHRIDDVE